MSDLFIFGTLLDDALRRLVAGCDLSGVPATLPERGVWRAAGGDWPVLGDGAGARGLLLTDVPEEALARLHFYEQGFDYVTGLCAVSVDGASRPAIVYLPAAPAAPSGVAWSLADWQADWGALTRAAAEEAMSYYGHLTGAALRDRMPMIRVRADARVRAAARPRPSWHDPALDRRAVEVRTAHRPYSNFFALAENDLTHRRFDGTTSGVMNRAGFVMGDAVTVLPYDPVRDRVLVVEQFRFGPFLRGDAWPWSLEPVAGRIDAGETPQTAARREAEEEAGLTLSRLLEMPSHYPSPAAVTEYLFSFVALCDLPDLKQGHGGLDSEHEDIRTHVMALDDLVALVDAGEVNNTPLLYTVFWLLRERTRPGAFA